MTQHKKQINTFGRRHGRTLSEPQKQLIEKLDNYKVDVASLSTDKSKILEIGFGYGEHLIERAKREPNKIFIGAEAYINGVANIMRDIEQHNITNIKLYPDDARDLVNNCPDSYFETIYILFADPWPKKKHHKRRIIQNEFIEQLAKIIQTNGKLIIATDHAEYAQWIITNLLNSSQFKWMAKTVDDCRNFPDDWVYTRYQTKGLAQVPVYLEFTKN